MQLKIPTSDGEYFEVLIGDSLLYSA